MGVSVRYLLLVLLALLAAPLRALAQPSDSAPAANAAPAQAEVPGQPAPAKEGTPEEIEDDPEVQQLYLGGAHG